MPHFDPFDTFVDEAKVSKDILVPNVLPIIHSTPYRIAIIGDAPSNDDVDQGKPFVGWIGHELNRWLNQNHILRDACFIGNLCLHRPAFNRLTAFEWTGEEIQRGIESLREQLLAFRPYICFLLGGAALHAFKEDYRLPVAKRRALKGEIVFNFPNSIGDWRGSFFTSSINGLLPGTKCIATYHPRECMKQYDYVPYALLDTTRMLKDATSPALDLPNRIFELNPTVEYIESQCQRICETKPKLSIDIEGYITGIPCLSLAWTSLEGFIVPFQKMDGTDYWQSLEDEVRVWRAVITVLSNPNVPKVLQNGLYDRFVLHWTYRLVIRNHKDDTMLKHWELYCELEKALGVQCSIYTKEPYYKSDRKTNSREVFFRYCCKDSSTTWEINDKLERYLDPPARKHYDFNMVLLNALLYMELRGIRYDVRGAKQRLQEIEHYIYDLQFKLDSLANRGVTTRDKVVLRALVRDTMCYKRDPSKPKADYKEAYDYNMRVLMSDSPLEDWEIGRLSTDLDMSLNTKGPDLKKYLYEDLGLPKQIDPTSKALTTDYDAMLKLRKLSNHPSIPLIIEIVELRTRAQMLHMTTDGDYRIRSSYNIVGTETGRVTSLTSPTGSGYNLQTIPDENPLKPEGHPLHAGMRDLVLADPGCYLIKADLKGADGWTIGCYLASLGYPGMLTDLQTGIKPASRLCYMVRCIRDISKVKLTNQDREVVKKLLEEVKKSNWDYFACKCVIWGLSYLMGVRLACATVFKQSEGLVLYTEKEMEAIKRALFEFYHIEKLHREFERLLLNQPYPPKLTPPSGHTRRYFGRKQEIVGQALADVPQEVTTYTTNQAVYRCWTDPENRRGKQLIVEPLHQVHDEFLAQCKIEDIEFAKCKYTEWFNNPITIAGQTVVIPYDGAYGLNWAMDGKSKIGII